MLGVSEAALIASRLGTGACALEPDVDRLLAPIADWGRTLVAVTNSAVVSLAFYEAPTISAAGSDWVLTGADGSVRIARTQVRHAYFFEDRDVHGNTHSVQLFDADGGAVAKVFIFAKSRLHGVRNHVQKVALMEQSPSALPVQARRARPAAPPPAPSITRSPDGSAPEPAVRFTRLFLALPQLAVPVEIAVSGCGAHQVSRGPVSSVEQAAGGVHVSETRLKLHMFPTRLASATNASDALQAGGEVRFNAVDGGRLQIRPLAAGSDWFAMLGRIEGANA